MPATRFAILTRARRRDPWELSTLHVGPRDAAQRSAHATLAQERRQGHRTEVLVVTEADWDTGRIKGHRPLASVEAVPVVGVPSAASAVPLPSAQPSAFSLQPSIAHP